MSESVVIKGRQFMLGGSRWSPKGICYQPEDNVDPLDDKNYDIISELLSPAGNWTKLGINAVRVYQVDPDASHDRVMSLLQSKNIYIEIGCVNTNIALPRNGKYPCHVLVRVKSVVDTFIKYPNVLSFSVSNELLDAANQETTAAVAKALVRDTKQYIRGKQNSRAIPVGLAMRDAPPIGTLDAARYYACGPESERADYIAYNEYRWCDYRSPNPQGAMDAWYELYEAFKEFPVPVYFGEFGCFNNPPRTWNQVPYLFGVKQLTPSNAGPVTMSDVISGGFAFRYYQRSEPNSGLVDNDGKPMPNGGFDALASQYGAIANFPMSAVSGTDPLGCGGYNPPMPAKCGDTGPAIKVTVTNEISPPTKVSWSYTTESVITKETKWVLIERMEAGAAPSQIDIPISATWLSLSFLANNGEWYGACRTSMQKIEAGNTVRGGWTPEGKGPCSVS